MSDMQEDIPADVSDLIRLGTIASVDLEARRCTVRYGVDDDADGGDEDGGATTPPIRWLAFRCGDTRVWSPPSVGEQVILLCPDGQLAAAIAVTGIEQDSFPLPSGGPGGLLLFKDGARIGYDADAHLLTALLPAEGAAIVEAPGGLTIKGDVRIEGNLTATGSIAADQEVTAGSVKLTEHRHPGVSSGGAKTEPPE